MTQAPNEPGRNPVEPQQNQRRRGTGGATPSRVGSLWVASILFAVVLLLLLIFVLQNGQSAKISFMGAHGDVPQGVALLLAAVFGILLVALPGTGRIIQLRIRDRRYRGVARTSPPLAPTVVADPFGSAGPASSPPAPMDATPPITNAPVSAPITTEPAAPVATQPGPPAQPPVQSPPPVDHR